MVLFPCKQNKIVACLCFTSLRKVLQCRAVPSRGLRVLSPSPRQCLTVALAITLIHNTVRGHPFGRATESFCLGSYLTNSLGKGIPKALLG